MSFHTRDLPTFGPIIPVIVIHELTSAVPLARALVAGGVRVLEVTLRTPIALQAIEQIVRAVPEAIVGAGTLRNVSDARSARSAGCAFGVSPGYARDLGLACRQSIQLPLLPGVCTPSELMNAMQDGYDFLKFFPAEAAGGIAMLKALAGPFADVTFCPTGGITIHNASAYLALPNVSVCGGSWLTPAHTVAQRDWSRITQLAREASALRIRPLDGSDAKRQAGVQS